MILRKKRKTLKNKTKPKRNENYLKNKKRKKHLKGNSKFSNKNKTLWSLMCIGELWISDFTMGMKTLTPRLLFFPYISTHYKTTFHFMLLCSLNSIVWKKTNLLHFRAFSTFWSYFRSVIQSMRYTNLTKKYKMMRSGSQLKTL